MLHCPKNNRNIRIKTEPVTVTAEAIRYMSVLGKQKSHTVTGTVLMRISSLFLGQCSGGGGGGGHLC